MKKRRWKKMTALSLLFIFFSSNHIPAELLPQDNPDETQKENEIENLVQFYFLDIYFFFIEYYRENFYEELKNRKR